MRNSRNTIVFVRNYLNTYIVKELLEYIYRQQMDDYLNIKNSNEPEKKWIQKFIILLMNK